MARSFKSVGNKSTSYIYTETVNPKPVGLKTPLRITTNREGPFSMYYSPQEQIHDNLRNLILTNKGERVGRYDFGGDMRALVFEYKSRDDFEAEAMIRIKSAVSKYLPVVELDMFNADFFKVDPHSLDGITKIVIQIKYNIPKLKVVGRAIEVNLYTGG